MSEEKKIKVVLLEPGKLARTAEIGTSLEDLQKIVDGLIEAYYPFEEQVCIVCNEESKINGMRPNRSVISSAALPLSATAGARASTAFPMNSLPVIQRCSAIPNTWRS
mgnify:CR=1 FL=1